MNITCTIDGEEVTVVNIGGNGTDIYVSYLDSSNNLKSKKLYLNPRTDSTTIGTSATIN